MSNSRDFLVFNYIVVIYLYLIIVLNQSNSRNSIFVHGKSLDNLEDKTCENVKYFFNILNVTVNGPNFDKKGEICNGHCCDNKAEDELLIKSINNLERLLQSHKRGIRGILERTAIGFRDHVLELSRQSENKTLNLFSQVYRKMSPLSKRSIMDLYESIRSHILMKDGTLNLDEVVNRFFINLFPVAYHHAVDESSSNGDFHIDYKNCLTHAYSDLQPFGEVPKQLSKNLVQSVGAATVLLKSLDQASVILSNTEKLDAEYITDRCKIHLLKMSYCTECKGMTKAKVKTCSAYCLNVMRGCLTQYIATIDAPWSSFATSISNLMQAVRSKDGIESVIKTLDGKLSEAIMHAMVNGPRLQKEVKQACGEPSLLPSEKHEPNEEQPVPLVSNKWSSPPMLEDMLNFLVVMDKSKDIYSQIIDTLCEDDEYKRDDKNCWTGSFVGEYTSSKLQTSISAQRYNPEVPYEDTTTTLRATKLTELSDEIVDLQRQVANAYSTRMIDGDKMLSDMPEGSGWIDNDNDDMDDYGASGSGAGNSDNMNTRVLDVASIEDPSRTRINHIPPSNPDNSAANANRNSVITLLISIFLSLIFLTKRLLL